MDNESRDQATRLRERLEAWREELLDLSKRNRLLNFRHTKASTLEIREPGYATLLDRLPRGWGFAQLPSQKEREAEEEHGKVSDGPPPPVVRGARGGIVTQKIYQEHLDKALSRLRKQSTTTELETGIWVLYLGVGFLRWKGLNEQNHSEAPLLLVPVELVMTEHGQHRLRASSAAEPLLNPALGMKLQEFGIVWDQVENVPLDEPGRILEVVRGCVSGQREWSVEEKVVLAPFTFHKETMYRDLKENEEAVLNHPVVRAIASTPDVHVDAQTLEYDLVPLSLLDRSQEPETAPLVLDADAYQRRAVAAALDGRSFVLDGPPGTGKSQTIANIIAALIGSGRTVLFVSEKAAALEVVHSRLAAVGIDVATLALHDGKTRGGAVATSLMDSLTAEVQPLPPGLTEARARTRSIRERLSEHARAVNEVDPETGLSPHQAMGRVARLSELLPPESELGMVTPESSLFTHQGRERILRTARDMTHVWDLIAFPETSPWHGVERAEDAQEAILKALTTLNRLKEHHSIFSRTTGTRHPFDLRTAQRWLVLLETLAERDDVPGHWLVCADFDETVTPRVTDAVNRLTGLAELRAQVDFDWRAVAALDTPAELGVLPVPGASGAQAELSDLTERQAEGAVELCATWTERMNRAGCLLEEVVRRTGVPAPADRASALRLVELLAEFSEGPLPDPRWLTEADFDRVRTALSAFAKDREDLQESRARAEDLFHPRTLEQQDLAELAERLNAWYQIQYLVSERSELPARWLAAHDFDAQVRRPVLSAWERRQDHVRAEEALRQHTDLPWQDLPDFGKGGTAEEVTGLDTEATAQRARADADFFEEWASRLRQVMVVADETSRTLACSGPKTPRQVRLLLEASTRLGADTLPLPAWLNEDTAETAHRALEHAEKVASDLEQARTASSDLFGPQALEQKELADLRRRFSGYSALSRLGSSYREDKKLAAALTVDGAWDKCIPARLKDAVRWQRTHRALEETADTCRPLLGHHWKEEETDFASVRSALESANLLMELLTESERSGVRRFLHQGRPLDEALLERVRTALDEFSLWEEAAHQLLPAEAELFERTLAQAESWLSAAADRLNVDASLAEMVTSATGTVVSTGKARAIRDCALRARATHEELRRHEEDDRLILGPYWEVSTEAEQRRLEQDLEWMEQAAQQFNTLVESVVDADGVDLSGIDSLREQARSADLDETLVRGALGRAFHRDRSQAAALTTDDRWRPEVFDRIHEALCWYKNHHRLWGRSSLLSEHLGRHWKGEGTDVSEAEEALAKAELCRREATVDEAKALACFLDHGSLHDLREDLEQTRADLSGWPGAAAALPGGRAVVQATPAEVRSWLGALQPQLQGTCALLRRFREVTGRSVIAAEVEQDVELARALGAAEADKEERRQADTELLGALYGVDEALGSTVQEALAWARGVRGLVADVAGTSTPGWSEGSADVLRTRCEAPALAETIAAWEKAAVSFAEVFDDLAGPRMAKALDGDLTQAETLLFALRDDISSLERWSVVLAGRKAMREHGLGPLLERYIDAGGDAELWPHAVEHAVLRAWVDLRLREEDGIRCEPGPVREAEIAEFRQRDAQLHEWARHEVLEQWSERRPPVMSYSPGLTTIRREAQKKRRHMPVRKLMEEVGWEAQSLTPCLMMSPLTVSMFLPSDLTFDVVVFDEASQVKPADAINCVYRGRSLIVAGDQKQLPPTGFFDRASSDDEWDEEQPETYESLLDMCKASGRMRDIPLRWHYRSRHEDLIAFSNRKFYTDELVTFPGARLRDKDTGVAFVKVDGVYDRGGSRSNQIEAAKVAERVIHHFQTRPGLTLGVVAMSREQANAIETAVEKALESHPEFRNRAGGGRLGGFFVKNLETVQGDERDVIILSVGYGPAADGHIRKNFGPLNKADGHRRLNVAVTRAKQRVEVVASFSADQLPVGPDESEGLRLLCEYLRYAEYGPLSLEAQPVEGHEADTKSPFEDSVLAVLRAWGYDVQSQVGVAGYRIDLGVRQPDLPGRYVLGVECDGAMYNSSPVARDRDRLRDGVLRGLGWRLHRIWGTDWYHDRIGAEERLREALEAAVRVERSNERKPMPNGFVSEKALEEPTPASDLVTIPSEDERDHDTPWAIERGRPWLRVYVEAKCEPAPEVRLYEPKDREILPHIRKLLLQIVEKESPIVVDLLYRRALGVLKPGGKLGSLVRANFDTALRGLLRKQLVRKEGETVWWPGGEVRVRRPAGETPRRVSEIPPVERKEALRRLIVEAGRIPKKDLLRSMRDVFEWKRSGKDITQAFEQDLRSLIADGVVVGKDGLIRPAEE